MPDLNTRITWHQLLVDGVLLAVIVPASFIVWDLHNTVLNALMIVSMTTLLVMSSFDVIDYVSDKRRRR
jgi:hypothetical protein